MRPPSTMPMAAQTRKSSRSSGFIGRCRRATGAGVGDQPLGIPPAEQDADDIGEAIPMDRQRPDAGR